MKDQEPHIIIVGDNAISREVILELQREYPVGLIKLEEDLTEQDKQNIAVNVGTIGYIDFNKPSFPHKQKWDFEDLEDTGTLVVEKNHKVKGKHAQPYYRKERW